MAIALKNGIDIKNTITVKKLWPITQENIKIDIDIIFPRDYDYKIKTILGER